MLADAASHPRFLFGAYRRPGQKRVRGGSDLGKHRVQVKLGIVGNDDVPFLPELCKSRGNVVWVRCPIEQLQGYRRVLENPR